MNFSLKSGDESAKPSSDAGVKPKAVNQIDFDIK